MRESDYGKLAELHPQVRPLFTAWLENCEQIHNIDMRVIESARTSERQDELYQIGRQQIITPQVGVEPTVKWEKVGPTVTNAQGKQSYHFWLVAVDAAPVEYLSTPDWHPEGPHWETMRKEARRVCLDTPMIWDKPHVQYTEGHRWNEWIVEFPGGVLPNDYFSGLTVARVEG